MDCPQEDYESLLEEELEMMRTGEIGYKSNENKQQSFLTEEEEQEILKTQYLQTPNANKSIGHSENTLHQGSRNLSTPMLEDISVIPGAPVNRRLFDTVFVDRITSTPFIAESNPIGKKTVEGDTHLKRSRLDRDIFGMDLYESESYTDPVAKKKKVEEEQDLETIEKIISLRQGVGVSSTKTSKENVLYLQNLHAFKMKNLSNAVPQWPFLPLRRSDKDRIFVRFHSVDYENRSIQDINIKPKTESLLGESKQHLWNEANDIISKRVQQRSSNEVQIIESTENIQDLEENLWVEKYKPRRYLDLLSAENTNRSLLFWLRMWDKVVFGRDFAPKTNLAEVSHKLSTFNKHTGKFESNGGWLTRRPRSNLDTNADAYGRPVQKVALLHGAPGLGKTTLAHILARHAGYQPLEINASDDRSPSSFQQALENGTQMLSLLNEDHRPNCIILDEIDGAPRQSIEFLVKFVTDNFQTKRLKGSRLPKKNILKRPIICICNDLYEPSLRSLRLIAFIVQFPPIQVLRLEERLRQIVKFERLKADSNALYALAQKTGNDVRSCISTLQFFKAENKAITLEDVANKGLNKKDQHQGLFAVWTKIFQIQRSSDYRSSFENNSGEHNASETVRVRNILESVQAAGDYQTLMNGVYENFLNQKLSDSNFSCIVDALQWFCFSDVIRQKINHEQNYKIYPYLQFPFAKWHLLFGSLVWPKVIFPSKGIEIRQKSATQRNVFESLRKGLLSSSGIGCFGLEGKSLLLEAVPVVKRIISPDLRHLPIELFSQRERQDLKHTVEIMADLGLTYVQIKSIEGTYQFQMEPDLESLVKFSGFTGVNLTYFGRQMLAREIEIERIHRAAPKLSGPISECLTKTSSKSGEKQTSNHLRKLQPKILLNPEKSLCTGNAISKYFGNILISNSKQSVPSNCVGKLEDPIVKSPIWYHYKEGFNNAVRKDIHMKELR